MKSAITRRKFVHSSLVGGLGLSVASSYANILSSPRPNNTLNIAIMGIRSRGTALAKAFAAQADCQVTYLCDVDERYFEPTIKEMTPYQKAKPQIEKDIRKILEDPDLDAVAIAAPDHWHAPAAIMACQAGKHVYLEKPCSHNPLEGEMVLEAAEKYSRVIQMGNQRRSWSNVQSAIQDLQSGVIGRVYFARGWYANTRGSIGYGKEVAVPDYLDYELWQGPAPRVPYRDNIHPYNWHWFWHWGTGEALNNGTHFLDLMRWGLDVDYPKRVVSAGGRYHYRDDWETPDTQMITLEFEGDKCMTWESRSCNSLPANGSSAGVTFHGEGGTLVIESGNAFRVYDNDRNPQMIKEVNEATHPNEQPDQQNTVGPGMQYDMGHIANFLQAIRDGVIPNSEIVGGHKSVLLCQLGNIAYRTGRALHIDQRNGRIVGDPEAMKLWGRDYEPGWELTV